jgi:hypothetical protein
MLEQTTDNKGRECYWWSSGSGRIELQIPRVAIGDCSHQGQCDEDVAYWSNEIDFSRISTDIMALELKEYGAWDDLQTAERQTLIERLTWIACCDLSEEQTMEEA